MSAVVWVAVLSTLVLIGFGIRAVIATCRQVSARMDEVIADTLADIDCARWDSEMGQ